jgi:hypothetical protein
MRRDLKVGGAVFELKFELSNLRAGSAKLSHCMRARPVTYIRLQRRNSMHSKINSSHNILGLGH